MFQLQKIANLVKKENQLKLKQAYMEAYQDPLFKAYVETLPLSDEVLAEYTSSIEDAVKELKNCKQCPGLKECPNDVKGHVLSAMKKEEGLIFSYLPCSKLRRKEKSLAYQKNITCYDLPKEIREASFQKMDKSDKKRFPIMEYFTEFIKAYKKGESPKGIYLHGSFGSGKTYMIAALFNELAKKDISSVLVYYPELLRSLKSSFGSDYEEKYEYIKKAPLLLLDDIGAENTTAWSRDEVLGPLLQYRMEEHLPTFFTSNFTLAELEKNLSITANGSEQVKAKRIIERIKQLTVDLSLNSKNRRE